MTHLIDENGVSHFRKRVVNDLENIVALLTPYRDSLVGLVVESTYNWYWLVDGLMDARFTVHLANTAAMLTGWLTCYAISYGSVHQSVSIH